jgi:aminomuconate-semialdehyde/2-hydroxymuconate-6-semialdehyde dehydrogenase
VNWPRRAFNLIGDRWLPAACGATFPTLNPATGEVLAPVADSGPEDVDRAVAAARDTFERAWRHRTAEERARILTRIADAIDANADALARLESADSGKPVALARTVDIPRASRNFRFFAGAILHAESACHPTDGAALNYTLRQPVGVAGLITPWNLPLYLLTWKVAPALAAGATCVAKPSELTPLTAVALGEIALEAGLDPGALNLVFGTGARAGAALVAHPDVAAISFTGGTATGEHVARAAAARFKKVSLELGGKNPNLVFADCDMDEAVATSIRSAFTNQGQVCLSGSRILVERPLMPRFVERFADRARAMIVGDPAADATEVGALISPEHLARVSGYVDLARSEGGHVACGGSRPDGLPAHLARGSFLAPTVITGLEPGSRCQTEEIFGPVVTVTPFDSDDEAVQLANATRYGLSATVWTRDLTRAHRVAAALEAGVVWVNTWLARDLRTPFGGMKDSGVGREGGQYSLELFSNVKNVCIRLS